MKKGGPISLTSLPLSFMHWVAHHSMHDWLKWKGHGCCPWRIAVPGLQGQSLWVYTKVYLEASTLVNEMDMNHSRVGNLLSNPLLLASVTGDFFWESNRNKSLISYPKNLKPFKCCEISIKLDWLRIFLAVKSVPYQVKYKITLGNQF